MAGFGGALAARFAGPGENVGSRTSDGHEREKAYVQENDGVSRGVGAGIFARDGHGPASSMRTRHTSISDKCIGSMRAPCI